MCCPRVMIAAPHGRSGKTTVSIGIVAALSSRGLKVQPFKKGPDYIDPSWLSSAGGRPCRNLDLFMMGEDATMAAFRHATASADVALIEGAMGLYDGLDLEGSGSSAALARLLGTPVLLVVDATRMTRSVAALVSGYQRFEPGVNIAGVVLNNVGHSRHEKMLVESIERYCGIPVVGSIPKRSELTITDRHLGLVPHGEDEELVPVVEEARRAVEQHLNLDLLLQIARSAPPMPEDNHAQATEMRAGPSSRIGVLLDRVFTFYYPENLEALEKAGARLVLVDSLVDPVLPEIDALYIGGGFPEVFMDQLEANESLRRDIRGRVHGGLPVYAECAGLIYLSQTVRWGNRKCEMVGALPCEIEMTRRPQGHGYTVAEVVEDSLFFTKGQVLRGHEFHNTRVSALDRSKVRFAYRLSKGFGVDADHNDGLMIDNILAAYTHLHATAVPSWAERFVQAAQDTRISVGKAG